MIETMVYQVIIAAGLFGFMLNLILNLRNLKKPHSDSKIPEPAPFVSVLIPARGEELNIETCLKSLEKQDYPDFEILVLDDNSLDNTANIVERIAAKDTRIQLIRGEPLAEGWAGKSFACYQLAKKARGDWLLFVDADTTHSSDMLRSVLALALEVRPSMLSGFPKQLTTSLPQKVTVPLIYFIIMSWMPLWWLQRSKRPKPSMAIGQFLLFPREEYWRIGSHKAVKSRVLEDIWLAVVVNQHGGRHVAVNLSSVVSCNMCPNLGGVWEGFTRWLQSVAALSPAALGGLIVAGYLFFLAPFYWLWNETLGSATASVWVPILIFQVVIVLFMRWLVDSNFKQSSVSVLLHPIGIAFLIVVATCGTLRHVLDIGVHWKERQYGKESRVT